MALVLAWLTAILFLSVILMCLLDSEGLFDGLVAKTLQALMFVESVLIVGGVVVLSVLAITKGL